MTGPALFENTTKIGDTLVRDMTNQTYKRMKFFRYALIAAVAVLLGAGIYDLLVVRAVRPIILLNFAGPVLFIYLYRAGKRTHAKRLRKTLLERNPEGQVNFVFYEDTFGYADSEDELGYVEGKRSAYTKITSSTLLTDTWVASIGGAMLAVSLNGFTKGSRTEFADFIMRKTRTEHK